MPAGTGGTGDSRPPPPRRRLRQTQKRPAAMPGVFVSDAGKRIRFNGVRVFFLISVREENDYQKTT